MPDTPPSTLPALRVNQWLSHWDDISWKPQEHRSEPPHSFYQFNISAHTLRRLSGVQRRTTDRVRGTSDLGIQRRHEPKRSAEIAQFVKYGYPWSVLSATKRQQPDFADLRQPGWLPTAILINILTADDKRRDQRVAEGDLVTVRHGDDMHHIVLPTGLDSEDWEYKTIPPIEVIDGQHRLWAFDESTLNGHFDLPVVAFVGLDLSWQAYLFYTINIKPKKINPSLAFDLYPLLRTETWLEKLEGPKVYRESRAQEIVDILWAHAESPWYRRINMLGEPGHRGLMVTQAGWIRSLLASFVKRWDGRASPGGLFGGPVGSHRTVLPWTLEQQSAFLIFLGRRFRTAIEEANHRWMSSLRQRLPDRYDQGDSAFVGRHNLLNQDQGLRAFLQVSNDICHVSATAWLIEELVSVSTDPDESRDVAVALRYFESSQLLCTYIDELSKSLARFDWRSSDAPGLAPDERLQRSAFRGSGGYRVLREALLRHLSDDDDNLTVGVDAAQVLKMLGFDE
jgi:DGQHR domain-containing protein